MPYNNVGYEILALIQVCTCKGLVVNKVSKHISKYLIKILFL